MKVAAEEPNSGLGSNGDRVRVIGIAPYSRGFGFAVLENRNRLLDYGVIRIRPWSRRAVAKSLSSVFQLNQPSAVVVERKDVQGSNQRRLEVIHAAQQLVREDASGITILTVPGPLGDHGRRADEVWRLVAQQLPELQPRLPVRRRPWMSYDERSHLFRAAWLALVSLGVYPSQPSCPGSPVSPQEDAC
jgi:hypothetical protein